MKTALRFVLTLFGRVTLEAVGVGVLIVVAVIAVLFWFNPLPPKSIRIATGASTNATSLLATQAKRYQAILAANGVTLNIVQSKGNFDNLQLLKQGKVDVGFVLGGIAAPEDAEHLVSLGSLYYDPIWVFYRKSLGRELSIRQLKGKRINIGGENSGIRLNAVKILGLFGIDDKNSSFSALSGREAYPLLNEGKLDAVFLAAPPESELLQKYLSDPDLALTISRDNPAIASRLTHLHVLHVPVGLISPAEQLPHQDLDLLASTMTLVARKDTHPAIQYLLMDALKQVHGAPTILGRKGEFPADKDTDFPLSETAEHFLKSGTPFLQRHFPFWLANLLDRILILVLPVLVVAFPFFKLLPAIYNWSMRSNIYRSYAKLLRLEAELSQPKAPLATDEALARLAAIEKHLADTSLPLAFSSERYILKEHIDLVRRSIRARDDQAAVPPPQKA